MLKTEFIAAREKSDRLMILLHGLGDSSAGFRWIPEALRLPWMNFLLVNAPDSYYGGFSWYDFTGDAGTGIKRSGRLLVELLEHQNAAGYPTEKTVLSGFSQGCLMTIETGLFYPRRFAALVGISGYVHEPDVALKNLSPVAKTQRFLVTHGFQDPLIPFAGVKQQIHDLRKAGLNIRWEEFQKAHSIAGETELSVIRDFIKGGYPD